MTWNELFPKEKQPTMEEIGNYVGSFQPTWSKVLSFFESIYQIKPKMSYSGCSGMPGWNLKFQKSSQAFGTWYPRDFGFGVMFIWSYKLDSEMMQLLPGLSEYMAEKCKNAEDFMKNGRWIMFRMDSEAVFEDYKKMVSIKLPPNTKKGKEEYIC